MDSREQNKRLEVRAGLALVGAHFDWRQTEISETPQAIATDPVRLSREGWWREAEPRPVNEFRRVGQKFIDSLTRRRARDGKAEEQNQYHLKDSSKGRVATDEDPLAEHMPEDGDSLWVWVDELPVSIDTNNSASQPWYAALRNFIHKNFSQDTQGRNLGEADLDAIRKLLKEIVGGAQ